MGKFNWTSVAEAYKEIPDQFNLVNPPIRGEFPLPGDIGKSADGISRYIHDTRCVPNRILDGSSLLW